MTDFVVVVPAVQQAAHASRAAGSDLRAELAVLRAEAESVLGSRWRGRAATRFEHEWGQWEQAAREVLAVLDDLADALAASGHAYEAQDSSGARLLAQAAS